LTGGESSPGRFGSLALRRSDIRRIVGGTELRHPNGSSEQWLNTMAYLYILQSLINNSYYIGSTKNLHQRIKFHNSGNVKSTKYKKPYILVFSQEFDNISIAHKVELRIKKWKRKDFIEKIIKDQRIKFMGH
jgi:putative endonuclease